MKRLCVLAALALCTFFSAANPAFADYSPDPHTVLLQHFEGTTNGENHGSVAYMPSAPGLGQAVDLDLDAWVKYQMTGWYTWPYAYDPAGKEGTIEMWVFPRNYPNSFFQLNWNNSNSGPPAGYILSIYLDTEGKLRAPAWCAIQAPPLKCCLRAAPRFPSTRGHMLPTPGRPLVEPSCT
ncbi:MAG: hypothetical protein WC709_02020 [Thermoleophilia bacterium]